MKKKVPKFDNVNSLLGEVRRLCDKELLKHKKQLTVSDGMSALYNVFSKSDGRKIRALEYAQRISASAEGEVIEWIESEIVFKLIDFIEKGIWFTKPRANSILFGVILSINKKPEQQLRIISNYVLGSEIPKTEDQLIDHLKIADLMLNINSNQRYFPSGVLTCLVHSLSKNSLYDFSIKQGTRNVIIKLLKKITSSGYPGVKKILPEISHSLKDPNLVKSNDDRMAEYRDERVFPPIIEMMDPLLEVIKKAKTEEQKLKKQRRKLTSQIMRANEAAAAQRAIDQAKAKIAKREERNQINRKALAELEAQGSWDLNIAAADPASFEEEEEKKESESDNEPEPTLEDAVRDVQKIVANASRKIRDPDINYDDDSEEESYDDDE